MSSIPLSGVLLLLLLLVRLKETPGWKKEAVETDAAKKLPSVVPSTGTQAMRQIVSWAYRRVYELWIIDEIINVRSSFETIIYFCCIPITGIFRWQFFYTHSQYLFHCPIGWCRKMLYIKNFPNQNHGFALCLWNTWITIRLHWRISLWKNWTKCIAKTGNTTMFCPCYDISYWMKENHRMSNNQILQHHNEAKITNF